jgi:DNA processing protein
VGPIKKLTPEELIGHLNEVEQKKAPSTLYVVGDLGVFANGSRVSVVGTRRPTPDGITRARTLVTAIVKRGMVVVSGLAEGIDTAAHETAIREGGRTIAVVGNGVDEFFPPSNRQLQETIAEDHVLVSQFAPGTPPNRTRFPQRNRTMALLSDATIIVEAGDSSGTLHQGWEALRLGRPLFLMESLTTRQDLTWPAEMIRFGAEVLSKANLDLVLDEMPTRTRDEVAF